MGQTSCILLGFECQCVAYAQWNKCDGTVNSTKFAAKLNYRRLTEINSCHLIAGIYFSEHWLSLEGVRNKGSWLYNYFKPVKWMRMMYSSLSDTGILRNAIFMLTSICHFPTFQVQVKFYGFASCYRCGREGSGYTSSWARDSLSSSQGSWRMLKRSSSSGVIKIRQGLKLPLTVR